MTDYKRFAEMAARIRENVEVVIRGKSDVIDLAIVCLVAEGHLLIEDVPGLGKTMLARAIAASVDAEYRRIQFTPDLLPSDVTGVSIYNQNTREFEFQMGPIFANVVLADEINRASPKTQSALLEVMEERRVTVDGEPRNVPRPFMVVATQNPIELEGTYRLPEAQLDRFLMRVEMGPPDLATEIDILRTHGERNPLDTLRPVVTGQDIAGMAAAANTVHVSEGILEYTARISQATRTTPEIRIGVSPRGTLALIRAARVRAAMDGREFVSPDDIRLLAPAVMNHRLILSPEAELLGRKAAAVLASVMDAIPVPQRRVNA